MRFWSPIYPTAERPTFCQVLDRERGFNSSIFFIWYWQMSELQNTYKLVEVTMTQKYKNKIKIKLTS